MVRVYLCGPINGRSDDECKTWRAQATELLGASNVLDPMRRDYRGVEADNVKAIVEGDKEDIDASTVFLVYFDRPSVGTSMEVLLAYQRGIPVVVVDAQDKPLSPWLVYHSSAVFRTVADAVAYITGAP